MFKAESARPANIIFKRVRARIKRELVNFDLWMIKIDI
jgi:hypothetical protein